MAIEKHLMPGLGDYYLARGYDRCHLVEVVAMPVKSGVPETWISIDGEYYGIEMIDQFKLSPSDSDALDFMHKVAEDWGFGRLEYIDGTHDLYKIF